MKKILFQDTSFRDGFQSFFGARVFTEDFLPAVEAAAHAGITHFEAGGGARFQALPLYCGESAFDMMDKFRAAAGPDANLQTLARGINVVALSAQPKDMIDLHAKMFKAHGITHIRNFDCLNDYRNLEYSAECITKYGLHHQVCITLMDLPPGCTGAHDTAFYIKTLRDILDSGLPFDSICFKDASGTASPKKVYETVKAARELLGPDVLLWIHTHATAGIGEAQYLAAIRAGIDGICVARKPVSGGTAQPDLLTMNHILKGEDYTLDIDHNKILEANNVFKDCMKDYFFPPEALAISPEVVFSPMPGGALTANTMMMRDTNTLHLYPKVIDAMAECVEKGGFGTSVTPLSQFYFQQAFANVTQGPWKKITVGYGKTVLGYYGKTPVRPDPAVVKIASEQLKLKPFTGNPLEILEPGIPSAKELLKENGLPLTEENIFTVGALQTPGGNKGLDFLKGLVKPNVRKGAFAKAKASGSKEQPDMKVTISGETFDVKVDSMISPHFIGSSAPSTKVVSKVKSVPSKASSPSPSSPKAAVSSGHTKVDAALPGNVFKLLVSVGDKVKKDDVVLILEAMKMENPILSPCDGVIESIHTEAGQNVETGQLLMEIS